MGADARGGPKVLLIEDDAAIAAGVVRGLRDAGFAIELAADGHRGAELALGATFDVIILDLTLPGRDGLEVLDLCRAQVSAPIIVLSARTSLSDRLEVFDRGAIDYLPKPFFADELIARIRARLGLARAARPSRIVAWADVVVDLDARTVAVTDASVSLTADELDILLFLLDRPGRAIHRSALAKVGVRRGERGDRTVDSHVARIRRKLGPAGGARIVTVWGIGYRFDPQGAA